MLPPDMPGTTITGAGQQTAWFDMRAAADIVCFNLTGDFSDGVGIRYSNNPAYDKGSDYTTDSGDPYTTKTGPLRLPFGIADFVTFFATGSWSAGKTCAVSFARSKDPNGQLVRIAAQSSGGLPGIG